MNPIEDDVQAAHNAHVQAARLQQEEFDDEMRDTVPEALPTTILHRHHFLVSHDPFTLPIYDDALIIHVGRKSGEPSATAEVWEQHRTDVVRTRQVPQRWFSVRGTGDPITGNVAYAGTWTDGPFVFHLYEHLDGKP